MTFNFIKIVSNLDGDATFDNEVFDTNNEEDKKFLDMMFNDGEEFYMNEDNRGSVEQTLIEYLFESRDDYNTVTIYLKEKEVTDLKLFLR